MERWYIRKTEGAFECFLSSLTLSGPAFLVVRQARGGSETRMAKIKVNINLLK